ncbi:MAG: DUF4340 domain-containing protein [Candidatus Eisenbacteria bacterium]
MRRATAALLSAALLASLARVPGCADRRGGEGEPALLFPRTEEPRDRLEIRSDSLEALFRREEGEWRIERPFPDRADPSRISGILVAIDAARVLRVVDDAPEGLVPYGLDPPAGSIAVPGGEVWFGTRNPSGDGVYVLRPPGREVLLADNALLPVATLTLGRVRDRVLLRFPARSVDRLAVLRGGSRTALRRLEPGRWLVEESGTRGDAAAVFGVLRLLAGDGVHSFQDSLPYEPGAEEIAVDLAWEGGEAGLRVGAAVPRTSLAQALATDRAKPFRIPLHLVDSLLVRAGGLVDLGLFAGNPLDARAVSFRSEEFSFELTRGEEGGWFLRAEETIPAFTPHVRALLRNLGRVVATGAVPPGSFSFREPAAWSIAVDAEAVEIAEDAGGLLARRAGEEGALRLDPAVRALLETRAGSLLEPPMPGF